MIQQLHGSGLEGRAEQTTTLDTCVETPTPFCRFTSVLAINSRGERRVQRIQSTPICACIMYDSSELPTTHLSMSQARDKRCHSRHACDGTGPSSAHAGINLPISMCQRPAMCTERIVQVARRGGLQAVKSAQRSLRTTMPPTVPERTHSASTAAGPTISFNRSSQRNLMPRA